MEHIAYAANNEKYRLPVTEGKVSTDMAIAFKLVYRMLGEAQRTYSVFSLDRMHKVAKH